MSGNPLLENDSPGSAEDLLPTQDLAPNSANELMRPREGGFDPEEWANTLGKKFDPIDYYVAEGVEEGSTGFVRATAKKLAADDWGRFSGVQRLLNLFTIPQDAVGRGLTKIMQSTGAMSDDDAKRMLSQDHVSPSDFLNYFTYDHSPESAGGKIMKAGLGLAMDMVLDPVMMFQLWGKAAKGGEVVVRGQTIPMDKLSTGERLKIRQAQKLEKILSADGKIQDVGELRAPPPPTDLPMSKPPGAPLSADDILNNLKGGATDAQVTQSLQEAQKSESFLEQLKTGERGWRFGIQIPLFTAYHGFDLQFLNRLTTMPLARLYDYVGTAVYDSGIGQTMFNNPQINAAFRQLKAFSSRTGNAIYDMGKAFTMGSYNAFRYKELRNFRTKWTNIIAGLPEDVRFAVRDELELTPHGYGSDEVTEAMDRASAMSREDFIRTEAERMREYVRQQHEAKNPRAPGVEAEPTVEQKSEEFMARAREAAREFAQGDEPDLAADHIARAEEALRDYMNRAEQQAREFHAQGDSAKARDHVNKARTFARQFRTRVRQDAEDLKNAGDGPEFDAKVDEFMARAGGAFEGFMENREGMDDVERVVSEIPFEPPMKKPTNADQAGMLWDATSRQNWLKSKSPEAMQFVAEAKELNQRMILAFQARPGIPFKELVARKAGEATSYLRHRWTDEYLRHMGAIVDQNAYTNDLLASTNMVDATARGRKFRGTINQANLKSALKTSQYARAQEEAAKFSQMNFEEKAKLMKDLYDKGGVKMLVDDPVQLVTMRAEEMARAIKNHDTMEAAVGECLVLNKRQDVPRGYVLYNKNHFGELFLQTPDKLEGVKEAGESVRGDMVYKGFIPRFFKEHHNIAVPAMVYDDLLHNFNPPTYTGFWHYYDKTMAMMNNMATNIFLTTIPYNARNVFSNALTARAAGINTTSFVDAMSILNPRWSPESTMSFLDATGKSYTLTHEQVWENLTKFGIMNSSFSVTPSPYDVARAVQDGWKSRRAFGATADKFKTFGDWAMLWAPARLLAKTADDVPKAALFIDRMKKGFTAEAAAESVFKYYYNYQESLKTFDTMRRRYGLFLSYPIKTMERVLSELKASELGNLATPAKVNNVLAGQFVEEPEVRDKLNALTPYYYKYGMSPVHGPLLPGGKEILFWAPWAYNSLTTFYDPTQNVHPFVQLVTAAIAYDDDANTDALRQVDPDRPSSLREWANSQWFNILKTTVPPYIREGLAVAEINGYLDSAYGKSEIPSTFFAERYEELPPVVNSIEGVQSPGSQRYGHDLQYAAYLEDSVRGQGLIGWIYDKMFPKHIDMADTDDPRDQYRVLQRANFIKKHFTDLTLGLATMTNMDREVMLRLSAIAKSRKLHTDAISKEAGKEGMLLNPDALTDDKKLEVMAQTNPHAAALRELNYKHAHIASYYGWYLGVNAQFPRANPWNRLFGIPDHEPDAEILREKPDYKELENIRTTDDDFPIPTGDPDVDSVLQKDNEEQ